MLVDVMFLSGHDIIFEQPDLVIAAIRQVVTGQKP